MSEQHMKALAGNGGAFAYLSLVEYAHFLVVRRQNLGLAFASSPDPKTTARVFLLRGRAVAL